jgi:hypothetical protein
MVNKLASSAVVYVGPSLLERRSPIVAVVTGLDGRSHNPKTRSMAQLWIIRSDMGPVEAAQRQLDSAVCGYCGLRGTGRKDRGCYVTLVNAPRAVFDAFKRKRYRWLSASAVNARLRDRGLTLRLGAYGDPAALPVGLLRELTAGIQHTGYTHQWRKRPHLRSLVMASCDSPQDFALASSQGWRSFRTRTDGQPLQPNEIICPASAEGQHRSSCDHCGLCDGRTSNTDARKHITIIAHGPVAVHAIKFIRSRSDV